MLTNITLFWSRYSVGKKSKSLGATGGYAKAIPDITAALKRGEIEGIPLFLMGHSYVRKDVPVDIRALLP